MRIENQHHKVIKEVERKNKIIKRQQIVKKLFNNLIQVSTATEVASNCNVVIENKINQLTVIILKRIQHLNY